MNSQLKIAIAFLVLITAQLTALSQPLKSVPEAGKVVALTFDDGIEPAIHKKMLNVLKQNSVSATFFLMGNKCDNKRLIKQTIKAGHEIGNHSMTHAVLPEVSTEKLRDEIVEFQKILKEDFAYTPKVFRAPKLQYDERVFQVLADENLIPVNATVGTKDYARETTIEYIVETATQSPKLGPGSIILMHEVAKTVEALPQIIACYREKGYAFCTVSELMERKCFTLNSMEK